MAKCDACGQEMTDGVGCTQVTFGGYDDGIARARIPFDGEPGERCHDCAAPSGALHHPGCDDEKCPRCGWQLIGCDCVSEDDDNEGNDA